MTLDESREDEGSPMRVEAVRVRVRVDGMKVSHFQSDSFAFFIKWLTCLTGHEGRREREES